MKETKANTRMLMVKDIQEILKIGRNRAYDIFAREDFPAILIGKKYVVEETAFCSWLKQRHERDTK